MRPAIPLRGKAAVPITNYDVSADDRRFLMLKPSAELRGPLQIKQATEWHKTHPIDLVKN